MRFNKLHISLIAIAIIAAFLASTLIHDMQVNREKARLESILSPVITKDAEGLPDPKPSLSFVIPTEKSLMVVLSWEQNVDAAIKNDVREKILTSVRRELSTDASSWGRHVSVIFQDEVITQGWK